MEQSSVLAGRRRRAGENTYKKYSLGIWSALIYFLRRREASLLRVQRLQLVNYISVATQLLCCADLCQRRPRSCALRKVLLQHGRAQLRRGQWGAALWSAPALSFFLAQLQDNWAQFRRQESKERMRVCAEGVSSSLRRDINEQIHSR